MLTPVEAVRAEQIQFLPRERQLQIALLTLQTPVEAKTRQVEEKG